MLALARAKHVSLDGGGLTLESIDMVELADSVVRTLLPSARVQQLDLGLETQNDLAEIQCVEWLLREAVSNLVDNAIRYSPFGGEVTVKVTRMENKVCIIVEDSGPGMSEQDIAQAGVKLRGKIRREQVWGWQLWKRLPKFMLEK
jgi:two-component system, OmpR family, sensor histidine kinase TctE